MSDEEKNAGDSGTATAALSVPREQPYPDEHTTVPNAPVGVAAGEQAAAGGKWEMPKPKFQQTSGYLPQGYLKDLKDAAGSAAPQAVSEDTTQEQAPFAVAAPLPAADGSRPAPPPAIEPQPDLADQLIPDEPLSEAPPANASSKSGHGFVAVILGVIGIFIFVLVFIAAVYFFFLGGRSGGGSTF